MNVPWGAVEEMSRGLWRHHRLLLADRRFGPSGRRGLEFSLHLMPKPQPSASDTPVTRTLANRPSVSSDPTQRSSTTSGLPRPLLEAGADQHLPSDSRA